MTKNMGTVDRLLRTLVAVILLSLIISQSLGGIVAVVLGVVAIVFLITSALGYCPAYPPLKLSTRKKAVG